VYDAKEELAEASAARKAARRSGNSRDLAAAQEATKEAKAALAKARKQRKAARRAAAAEKR
jgi:hypothetical protein